MRTFASANYEVPIGAAETAPYHMVALALSCEFSCNAPLSKIPQVYFLTQRVQSQKKLSCSKYTRTSGAWFINT
jgi:hypothetical protein